MLCAPALRHGFRNLMKQRGAMLAKGRLLGVQFETMFTDGLYLECGRSAVEAARLGAGPSLLECMTYRLTGHSKGDPRVYRTREEEAQAAKNDPIVRLENRLRAEATVTDAMLERCQAAARETIDACVAFAEESPAADARRFRAGLFA